MIAGVCVFGVLFFGINNAVAPAGQSAWSLRDERPSIADGAGGDAVTVARRDAVNNMAKVVGRELMTRYVVGFEVAGLLLTVALVGAIALAHREEPEPVATPSDATPARRTAPLEYETTSPG
jgi:NADH-quinone oxidoreductase subunit J